MTRVVTAANVAATFALAKPGDTLRFIGNFGETRLQNRSFSHAVTLDLTHATFTDTLILTHDSNVSVSGGTFDVTHGSSYDKAVFIDYASGISFTNPVVRGVADQFGIIFENSSHVTTLGGHFDGLHVAIGYNTVDHGTAKGNVITRAVADGIDIGDSHFVTASSNTCSAGMPGPGVHPDCIQLWSLTGRPIQSDNVVTGNSATGATQGFTSFATGGGGLRLTITHNIVNSSYPQGVACYDCVDSTISFNSVSTLPGADHLTNINIIGGSGNSVVDNVIHPRGNGNTASIVDDGLTGSADDMLSSADARLAGNQLAADGYNALLDGSGRVDGVNAVPEPAEWGMMVAGFLVVGSLRRRAVRRLAA